MTIVTTGFVQGAGLGFLFVPLTTVAFATLAPEQRGDATGLYNLSRNVGSSVGISVVSYLLVRYGQINHAEIAGHVTAVNHAFNNPAVRHALSPWTLPGRAALDQAIQNQAAIISYIDDFKLMMILSLIVTPLLLLLRRGSTGAAPAAVVD
jgi:DHA2 family multidrug resistance protein